MVGLEHIIEYMLGLFNVILAVFGSDKKIEVSPEVSETIQGWIDTFKGTEA